MPSPATVIVGAGLGGLSAAIHLRAAGHDVEVYEANPEVGGRASRIRRDGFSFDTGPSLLNYPWVFEDLFRAAGRSLGDYVELLPVDPTVTFQWPDQERLTLSSQLPRLLAELERLEPGCTPRALAFLQDAARKYEVAFSRLVTQNEDRFDRWIRGVGLIELARMGVGTTLERELRRFFRSRRIREALGSYGMYLGGSPFDLPGFFSILPYGELAYGLWLPRGGIYGLVSAMARLAADIGVRIHTSRAVTRIGRDQSGVTGIELADGAWIPATIVVSNVDVPTTDTALVSPPPGPRPATGPVMTPGVLTFYWGVRGRVEGIGHHTIFLPEDFRGTFADLFERQRMPDAPAFYVSLPSETDRSLAPEGDTAIFVLVPAPLADALDPDQWLALRSTVRRRVLDRLRHHGVSLDPAAIVTEEVYDPPEWARRFGLHRGSAFGAAHTLRQLGPWRSPNRHRSIRGLYYVGAGTTPGTGLPMVVLSGRMVAARIGATAADRSTVTVAG